MISTLTIRRLCFPEPEGGAGGAGSAGAEPHDDNKPEPAAPSEPSDADNKASGSPWRFDVNSEDDSDADTDEGKEPEDEQKEEKAEPEPEPVTLSLPEELGVPEEYQSMLAEVAREKGLNSAQLTAFADEVFRRDRKMRDALWTEQDRRIREELGSEYESAMKRGRAFGPKLAKMCGLSNAEMESFMSPLGNYALYKIAKRLGEGRVKTAPSVALSPREAAQDMMENPKNPFYKGLRSAKATTAERREAARAYNKAIGYKFLPE